MGIMSEEFSALIEEYSALINDLTTIFHETATTMTSFLEAIDVSHGLESKTVSVPLTLIFILPLG